jgi:hypothetical protein
MSMVGTKTIAVPGHHRAGGPSRGADMDAELGVNE